MFIFLKFIDNVYTFFLLFPSYMTEEHEETSYTLRIGSLILHNIGQLLPHQLQSAVFHNRNFIYPVSAEALFL